MRVQPAGRAELNEVGDRLKLAQNKSTIAAIIWGGSLRDWAFSSLGMANSEHNAAPVSNARKWHMGYRICAGGYGIKKLSFGKDAVGTMVLCQNFPKQIIGNFCPSAR